MVEGSGWTTFIGAHFPHFLVDSVMAFDSYNRDRN